MNILIPDSWLREFIKTRATPRQVAEYLSLCSQSVEKTTRVGNDWVYEIEVTTNRPDCLSVYGIARELTAILPRFGILTKLENSFARPGLAKLGRNGLPLEVEITDPTLCPRFTAIIFDDVKIGPSPKIVQERLEKTGIRALNNIVDISNYLMLELGQPMHTFDYDKISGAKMILRESREGEKITTLDGQTRILPKDAIIIEDGKGRIIDLCGIMGGENSAVEEKTKRVLLFVQTYDPAKIRRACQLLSFRTEAAARFEKGVDPESVIPAIKKAIEMFEKNCGARVASNLIDIYPNPPKPKIINFDLNLINRIIGLEIPKNEIIDILKSLGFSLITKTRSRQWQKIAIPALRDNQLLITITVPPWRYNDISIPEDLIEEIARIWGFHRLPSLLPPGTSSGSKETKFFWEEKIKNALKYWGFTEVVSYSIVSQDLLNNVGLDPYDFLKIANPLTEDQVYMRPTIIPSLLLIVSQNQANFPDQRLFEIANIYIPQSEERLPEEIRMLSGLKTGKKFLETKGILEALFEDLGIADFQFVPITSKPFVLQPAKSAEIIINRKPIGFLGEVENKILHHFEISQKAIIFDLEFDSLIRAVSLFKKYTPIPVFPPTVEDLSFVVIGKVAVAKIMETIKSIDKLIVDTQLLDSFESTQTFRLTYQSPTRTLSGEEVGKIREKIIRVVKEKFGAKLKS